MEATRGVLVLLRVLAERPRTPAEIASLLKEEALNRNERTVRRWMAVLRQAGFEITFSEGRYSLQGSPVHLAFDGYEALATLSVLGSLADREPVYGRYIASALGKLREAIPQESLRFADSGKIEFYFNPASDPPEDPAVIDKLRRAIHQSRQVEILYHSLRSQTVRQRTVEPVRIAYAQRAHRLYAYEREAGRVQEFRVNRIRGAKMLPEKFAPEAHIASFEQVSLRLSAKTFVAFGKSIIPDDEASIEPLADGSAIVSGSTPSTFWTVREIASLGPEVEVLGSPSFRREFLDFLHQTLQLYS